MASSASPLHPSRTIINRRYKYFFNFFILILRLLISRKISVDCFCSNKENYSLKYKMPNKYVLFEVCPFAPEKKIYVNYIKTSLEGLSSVKVFFCLCVNLQKISLLDYNQWHNRLNLNYFLSLIFLIYDYEMY